MKNRYTETPLFHIAASAGIVIFAILVGGAAASKIANTGTSSNTVSVSSTVQKTTSASSVAAVVDDGERFYELASAYESTGDYAKALDTLSQILPSSAKYADAIEKTASVKAAYYNVATNNSAAAYNAGNYDSAIQILNDAVERMPESAELAVAYDHLLTDCKNALLANAESCNSASGWKAALDVLNNVPTQLKSDTDIIAQINDYRKSGATRLDMMRVFRGSSFSNYGTVEDCFGTNHENSLHMYAGSMMSNLSAVRLDKQYSTFTGTVFTASTGGWAGDLIITGDDVQLQRITMNGGDDPVTFEIDVSNVKDLEVESINCGFTPIYLSDAMLLP